ncbi:MAG: phenylalanine--tRNA ligase subunit beta, partial [Euryarchaeota archaeon]|nr:phenylalanine--tRNA ligase subunit beta [Euryarchaeota archaeon]
AVGGSSISFVPLGMYSPMTPEEILRNHPKGVEYGHLLSHSSLYPIIIDSDGNVLSMPPIINGTLTQIREDTKNIFIDVTGNDLFTVINAVNLISSNLAELGGYLYRVLIDYGDYSLFLPDLGRERIYVSKRELKEMVGEDINANDVKNSLISMGYTVSKSGNGFNVGIPPYRLDIMHPVDVIEDIIKSYGYGNLRLSLPNKFSMGSEAYSEIIKERIRRIMVGLGYIEVVSLTFTSPERNFKRFGIDETYSPRITNPVVEDQTIYRTWLIPMLMETLENNRHRSLPQRIFEVGRVYRNGEGLDLGALSEESDASFTKVKGTVEKIINSLGQRLEIEEKNLPFLIQGRQSSIILNGKEVGFFGEVHPSIIEKYNLGNPITAFEIYLDVIYPDILNEKLKF